MAPPRRRRPGPAGVLAGAFLAGSVPCSGIAARLTAGVDLRTVGTGTVSGTGLYQVSGFAPLAVAGSLDVLKGAVGPALAGRDRPVLAAAAAAAAVTGHNWSPWLGGAGGRGISPGIGALGVLAPEGSAVLLAGLALGRLIRRTAEAGLVALLALPVVGAVRRGWRGLLAGLAVTAPMLAKRLAGNRPAQGDRKAVYRSRLLYDRDPPG